MSTQISLEKSIARLNTSYDYVKNAKRYDTADLFYSINLTKNILLSHSLEAVTIENYFKHDACSIDNRKTIALEVISKGIVALTIALIASVIGIVLWMTGRKSGGSGSKAAVPTTEVAKEVKQKNIEKVDEIKEMVSVKKKLITQINAPISSNVSGSNSSGVKPEIKIPHAGIKKSNTLKESSSNVSDIKDVKSEPVVKNDHSSNERSGKNLPSPADEISEEAKGWFTRHKETFLKNAGDREALLLKKYFLKK